MVDYINGYGRKDFVPLVPCQMNVMGIQRTMHHGIDEYAHQMDLKRGFVQVLREEYLALTNPNDSALMESMKEAQYFTMSALAKVYPVLAYLVKQDNQLEIGNRYATVGTVEKPMHLVKVGEATSKDDTGWKCGIYRVSPAMLPKEVG